MKYEDMLEKKKFWDENCKMSDIDREIITNYTLYLIEMVQKMNPQNKVIVITDYDADGVCSGYIASKMLDAMKVNYEIVVNSRFDEGYSLPSINVEKGDQIIILDNGTNAYEYTKEITKNTGRKPFVIDHHISEDGNSFKYSNILNFQLKMDANVPDYCTSGLMTHIYEVFHDYCVINKDCKEAVESLNDCLIMGGIGTVADMVTTTNLCDDNRKIISTAQTIMNKATSWGDTDSNKYAISDELGMFLFNANKGNFGKESKGMVTTRDIQFNIAPAINACGRLDENAPLEFLNSLKGKDNGEGIAKAFELNETRKEWKEFVLNSDEYKEIYNSDSPINILISENIPQGICGLIAGNLSENGKPSIVVTRTSFGYVGSGRNSEGYPSLYGTCKKTMDNICDSFGGHENACGLVIQNPKDLYKLYDVYKDVEIDKANIEVTEPLDNPEVLTPARLYKLEPFGVDNLPPYVDKTITVDARVSLGRPEWAKVITKDKLDYVTFSQGDKIKKGDTINVKGELGINRFRGQTTVQVNIENVSNELEKDLLETNEDISKE